MISSVTHLAQRLIFLRHHDMWHTCSAAHSLHNHSYSFHTVHLPCGRDVTQLFYNYEVKPAGMRMNKVLIYIYAWPTFSLTAALAVTVQAIKGKPASCSPSLDTKCTLTVLGWTRVRHKLLGVVILCSPQSSLGNWKTMYVSFIICNCWSEVTVCVAYSLWGLYCVHCSPGCLGSGSHTHRWCTCCLVVVQQTAHNQEDS